MATKNQSGDSSWLPLTPDKAFESRTPLDYQYEEDTNLKPKSTKMKKHRTKMKKHRPKVVIDIGITPKKTPMRTNCKINTPPTKKRKYVMKNNFVGWDKDGKKHEITSQRHLNFDIEDHSMTKIQNNVAENILSKPEALKWSSKSFRVYKRAFKCLSLIRKLPSHFPTICKKKRLNKRQKEKRFSSQPWLHSLTGRESFACMVSLCNLKLDIKKKKRSDKAKARKDMSSLVVVPKCNQSPISNVLCNPIGKIEKKMEHTELLPAKSKKRVNKKQTEIGLDSNMKSTVPIKRKRVSKKQNNINMKHSSPLDSEDEDHATICKFTKKFIKEVEAITMKLEKLNINDDNNGSGVIVPFVPKIKREKPAEVDLDEESLRAWNRLKLKDGSESDNNIEDEKTRKWWENEQEVFCRKAKLFVECLRDIQGKRSFSAWKGSVVDSVVGVFLTQNVSDHLSSSAFMSLAVKYPIKPATDHEPGSEDLKLIDNNESIGNNKEVEEQISRGETILCMAHESKNETETLNVLKPVALDEDTTVNNCDITDEIKNLHEEIRSSGMDVNEETPVHKKKKISAKKQKEAAEKKPKIYWENLRKLHSNSQSQRSPETMDSVDWEAVQRASLEEISDTIRHRGLQKQIGINIKKFLDRLVADHGSIDLEWLRTVPPKDAEEYLLSFDRIGPKSVDCVRLLSLQHKAFPVDTNVGRVTVRTGWVPIRSLEDSLQMHMLNTYPVMESIQKYIWPRLCKLHLLELYELHYHMITFGKIFCTKRKPNCNACPMKGDCKHYASKIASERLALPASNEKIDTNTTENQTPYALSYPNANTLSESGCQTINCEPIIELPASKEKSDTNTNENQATYALSYPNANTLSESGCQHSNCEPIIELPASPELKYAALPEMDIEDYFNDDPDEIDEIPTLVLNDKTFVENLSEKDNMAFQEDDSSKAIVSMHPWTPRRPELKYVRRLRTHHHVYVLPDSHPILEGLEGRHPDDRYPYLFAIWPGETKDLMEQLIDGTVPDSRDSKTICGTILIPVRTAMRGSFPLNGTYFQPNEILADYETSLRPINTSTASLWKLQRRIVFCGASVTSIYRDFSVEEIRKCALEGLVCVRGFERETRSPRPLSRRFHAPPKTSPAKPWVPKPRKGSKQKN